MTYIFQLGFKSDTELPKNPKMEQKREQVLQSLDLGTNDLKNKILDNTTDLADHLKKNVIKYLDTVINKIKSGEYEEANAYWTLFTRNLSDTLKLPEIGQTSEQINSISHNNNLIKSIKTNPEASKFQGIDINELYKSLESSTAKQKTLYGKSKNPIGFHSHKNRKIVEE